MNHEPPSPRTGARPFPARLLVVADRDYINDDARWLALIAEVGAAAVGRPVAIQVRTKLASPQDAETLAARARGAVPADVPLLLNGNAALAERLGYTGVHWPEQDIPDAAVATSVAYRSAAVHSVEATHRAIRAGADLVLFGSIYDPGSKRGVGVGLEPLRAVARVAHPAEVPVFALGGVLSRQVGECIAAGAFGVAAVSGILGVPDVRAAIEVYLRAIDEAVARTRTSVAERAVREEEAKR